MDSYSIAECRETALKFCFGYYLMSVDNEYGSLENGLGMLCDSRPLSKQEKNEIVRLIEIDRSVREYYILRFKDARKGFI
jgi:hypothetical protein